MNSRLWKSCLIFLLLSAPLLASISYESKVLQQNWKFDSDASLTQLTTLSGKWVISTPATLNQPLLSQSIKYADFPKVVVKDIDFFDFEATTRLYLSNQSQEVQSAGLILRYRNLYSFYMLFLNTKDKRLTLTKASRGGLKVVKRVERDFTPERWYELKAVCYLNHIKGFVNGDLVLEAEDETTTGGKVGLVTAGTTQAYFESLQVRAENIDLVKQ